MKQYVGKEVVWSSGEKITIKDINGFCLIGIGGFKELSVQYWPQFNRYGIRYTVKCTVSAEGEVESGKRDFTEGYAEILMLIPNEQNN